MPGTMHDRVAVWSSYVFWPLHHGQLFPEHTSELLTHYLEVCTDLLVFLVVVEAVPPFVDLVCSM
jgi:hypothetical protein